MRRKIDFHFQLTLEAQKRSSKSITEDYINLHLTHVAFWMLTNFIRKTSNNISNVAYLGESFFHHGCRNIKRAWLFPKLGKLTSYQKYKLRQQWLCMRRISCDRLQNIHFFLFFFKAILLDWRLPLILPVCLQYFGQSNFTEWAIKN